ncbi:hypothetical protein ACPV3S_19935 [Photobacterium damselae]|uniref:hypothetical protein n=1 Tax=Photobacterium damselae TaxID=38293 RepID=UPI0040692D1B
MAAIIKNDFLDNLKWYKKQIMDHIPYYYRNSKYRSCYDYLVNSENESIYSLEKLNNILNHCYKNIPYYGKLFEIEQIDPKLKCLDDLKKIPILTKELISKNSDDLLYKNGKCKVKKCTGGTTGLPMTFWTDRNDAIRENAFVHYHWSKFGFDNKKSNRVAILRGVIPRNGHYYEKNHNNLILSTFMLSENTISFYIEQLNNFDPEFLHVYPSSLDLFTSLLNHSHINLKLKNLKAIFTSSENLNNYQKRMFEKVFNVPVSDLYGHSEHCVFAIKNGNNDIYEIEHRYGFVELLKDNESIINNSDLVGDIVSTSYHNYIMPLIRYKTGDRAISSGSDAGFKAIVGREQDFFIDKNGSNIPYICNDEAIWCIKEKIKAYQYHQYLAGHVILKLEPKSEISEVELEKIYEQFYHIYPTLILTIENNCEIKRTDKGKFKYLVKKIK